MKHKSFCTILASVALIIASPMARSAYEADSFQLLIETLNDVENQPT